MEFQRPGRLAGSVRVRRRRPGFWLKSSSATCAELYVAFTATSKAAVDNAYTAALANGGADNGPPGQRPQFGDRYYAAKSAGSGPLQLGGQLQAVAVRRTRSRFQPGPADHRVKEIAVTQ
jgi:hypothetical protein